MLPQPQHIVYMDMVYRAYGYGVYVNTAACSIYRNILYAKLTNIYIFIDKVMLRIFVNSKTSIIFFCKFQAFAKQMLVNIKVLVDLF